MAEGPLSRTDIKWRWIRVSNINWRWISTSRMFRPHRCPTPSQWRCETQWNPSTDATLAVLVRATPWQSLLFQSVQNILCFTPAKILRKLRLLGVAEPESERRSTRGRAEVVQQSQLTFQSGNNNVALKCTHTVSRRTLQDGLTKSF